MSWWGSEAINLVTTYGIREWGFPLYLPPHGSGVGGTRSWEEVQLRRREIAREKKRGGEKPPFVAVLPEFFDRLAGPSLAIWVPSGEGHHIQLIACISDYKSRCQLSTVAQNLPKSPQAEQAAAACHHILGRYSANSGDYRPHRHIQKLHVTTNYKHRPRPIVGKCHASCGVIIIVG